MLGYIFNGLPITCVKAADSNDDGAVDVADATHLLGYIFSGNGGSLPIPSEGCGTDTTEDALTCESFGVCQ